MGRNNYSGYREFVDEEEAVAYTIAAQTGQGDRWKLSPNEQLWVQHQPYLLEKGYQLRPRYRPGWVRSWTGTNRNPRICEDSLAIGSFKVMDAIHISDGKRVIIKAFNNEASPDELRIMQYLGADNIRSDPRNHCVYALDSFPVPGRETWTFVIMESLYPIMLVPFETVGEIVELTYQLLEGLAFMHEHNLAHRDCARSNIVMKANDLFETPPHPHPHYSYLTEDGTRDVRYFSRKGRNVKYYFIDYGISTLFSSFQERTLVTGEDGRERDVPELMTPDEPYDPFKVDIFIIGIFLTRDFLSKASQGLGFLEPLLTRMTNDDPAERPTATEALSEFQTIRNRLGSHLLIRPLQPNFFQATFYAVFDYLLSFSRWFKRSILRRQEIALPT